ncbi:Vitamin B12 transporter [Methylocella tundrae]|uniref:Vitamin B12 transporter n=1 Tax=Methylocella tundrae TaxID=227605 RepID=A0A8B6MAB3_METTU|nr:TonB-dependent receptor [Methylocella tundrae]VTZ51681.1 Vitamin B12 transporter [Methylocella tundrae]
MSSSCPSALRLRALTPCFFLVAFSFDSSRAYAQDASAPPVELPPVVVGATLIPTPESELGTSVTVISADEIAAKQQRTLPDALLDVPGLNVVQTGGPGGLTSVFIRGANSNQTKVLIDGIDVSDPSSPDGGFDFAHILNFDLGSIEVLRGPQSGLYGSEAIGGVINIATEKGYGPMLATANVEGGSFGTFNQTAKVSGSADWLSCFLGFGHFSTTDTPITPPSLVPIGRAINPNAYDNRTFSFRVDAHLADQLDVGLTSRYIETTLRSTSDDFLGPENLRSNNGSDQSLSRAFIHNTLFDGRFDQTLGLAYTHYDRSYLDPNSIPIVPSFYEGSRIKLDYQGNVRLIEGETLVLGAQREVDRLVNSNPVWAVNGDTAGFAELQSNIGGRLFNAASIRYDANDQFGNATTFRIAPAFLIPETGTRLKGSVGTGFKAPTLDELYDNYPAYGFFANPNLQPETSIGFDAGFEQTLLPDRISFGATYFANNIKYLININDTATSYVNIGRARTSGLESFMSLSPWNGFSVRADYTYTVAKDETTQLDLLRRPRDKFSISVTLQATPALLLSATFVYTGPWADTNRAGTATNLVAPGYTLLNLAATYDFGHGISGFARVQNALNDHYQNPFGFDQPTLGVFGGVKVALGQDGLL